MQLHQALNSRRIARTLVTVFTLSFIQGISAPVLIPQLAAPKAEAVDVAYANATTGTDVVVPAGVYSVTLTARGGAGGTGGADASAGTAGTNVGYAAGTFAVTPGDRITIWPGGAGGTGASAASNNGGGSAGAPSIPTNSNVLTPSLKFNGSYSNTAFLGGGTGGNAGSGGSSGAGGGGGAGSIVVINDDVALIAGGGGGGAGGSGPGAQSWNGTYVANTSSLGANGIYGGGCGNSDGGGTGAGGGGWQGGAAGVLDRPGGSGECRAWAGSPGANFVASSGSSTSSSYTTANGAGLISYVFNYSSTTACSTTSQVVDIYTVVKVVTTANCTWAVPANVSVVDLFLVGGGGGGAGDSGPGGNGGYATSRTAVPVTPSSTMTLKVGYGGGASSWGYTSSAYSGDATTVVTSTGATYSALGGQTGGNNPTGTATTPSAAANGSFAGGMGGNGAGCFASGAAGKRGISNYFYGALNTYAGGGGSGACPNGAATTPAAGSDGGGQGGYASSASVNQPGTAGTDGTGGGGGGGTAVGTGLRLIGGKGGSGVILIRYTSDAANSFPADLSSALSARWSADGMQLLDSSRKGWIDSSGTNASRINSNFAGNPTLKYQGTMDGANSTYSTKSLLTAAGGQQDGVSLAELPSNYTLFHVARYVTGGQNKRIIQTSSGNWLSGHFSGLTGATHHNGWLTESNSNTGQTYGWLLSTDQIRSYRANGKDLSKRRDFIPAQSTSTGFGINIANATWNEYSDWQVNDVLVFNRELLAGEIRAVEKYLSRIYGLTLAPDAQDYETDTAATFDGGQYFYTNYDYGNLMNDTFTVEAWVNPAQTCINVGGARCGVFARENTLVTSIYQGNFEYALYGSNSAWEYINTGVKFKAGEWHHIALVKDQPACVNGSLKLYIDGQLAYTNPNSPYRGTNVACGGSTDIVYPENTWTYIGARAWDYERFSGQIDEVKVWKVARTLSQIATDMHSNDASSKSLQAYYDFNRSAGTSATHIPNLAAGGASRSDMIPLGTMSFTDVKISTNSGPYTTIKFPRTYITQYGGWKVPANITQASTIVVGGGGGGGYGNTNNRPAGGGGGGGVTASLLQNYTPGATVTVKVGAGGLGGFSLSDASVRNGQASMLGVGGGLTALGGGGGGNASGNGAGGSDVATGGGSGESSYTCTGSTPNAQPSGTLTPGATVTSGYNGGGGIWGWGGSGGGARGAATNGDCNNIQAGIPGPGFVDPVTSIEYGRGGSATSYATTYYTAGNTTQNNGWGGVISYNGGATPGANTAGLGYRGSFGVVVVRYLTASKPAYTPPTNAYLNVGMTETFTTNVAMDSATVGLTRTFKWESTTAGSGGTYSTIKTGTGAANAAYSWIPTDTSTSGSQYLYRVVVTDSDTVGLFVQDTSSAVYAVINPPLQMNGPTVIKKQINLARSETFTITAGTQNYRYTLTPALPGVTLDTSSVGAVVLRISETASVGTYLETLTVTDSVSASVVIPISLTISAPPSLVNNGEIVEKDLIFNIDMSNSASYSKSTGLISDISGTKKPVTIVGGSTYSDDYFGSLKLSSSQYISATGFGSLNAFTIEAYVNLRSISNEQVCIFSSEQTVTNIAYFLCIDTTRTVFTGFFNGSWTYKRTSQQLTLGAWAHVVGVFDSTTSGARTELYINGVATTYSDGAENAGLVPPAPNTDKVFINKWTWTATAPTSAMDIGFVRLYRAPLSLTKVQQNYNATKDRFASTNINQLKPSQKYGTLNLDSFTVTSGGDTKTVTFAVGDRTGIDWDTTSTPGQVKLSVQESLTPGTYYDTVTVTDNFGQSTTLPIKFTVTKADTITVIAGAATSQIYNKSPASSLPTFTINGLVSSDTGTLQRKYTGVDWSKSCALGGGCEVGDTGPGGGTIFYISPTVIDSATGISSGGTYLEVAPLNWSGLSVESTTAWAKAATSVAGTLSAIGKGAENTRLINAALTTNSVAAKIAADLTLNGKSDWFLPSTLEVKEIYDALYAPGLAGNLSVRNYWTSTQGSTTSQAETYWFGSGGLISPTDKLNSFTLRPIRAYSPDTITVTTVPTDVDSYTVTVDTLTMTSGSLSYYEGIVFQKSGLNIAKASQAPLNVNLYGGVFGIPFTIQLLGGSGTGAVTESFTAGSTAVGCALNAHVLTSTSPGACNMMIKKAASRNYFSESTTVSVYLLNFVLNQPSGQVGSGSGIAINGETPIVRDPNAAPTISSLSTSTAEAGVTQIVINGAGFDHTNLAAITVKFWRNVVASGFTVNAGDSQITVTVPIGATSGRVSVTTPNGTAVSEFALTVTPYSGLANA